MYIFLGIGLIIGLAILASKEKWYKLWRDFNSSNWQVRADPPGYKATIAVHSCPGMPAEGYDQALAADCTKSVVWRCIGFRMEGGKFL